MKIIRLKEVDVYSFRISECLPKIDYFYSILSHDEIKKMNRYYKDSDKKTYIVCRGLLRDLLAQYIKIPPKDIVFMYGKHGKPGLVKYDIHFNLSHSVDFAIIGISKYYPLGVDIEKKIFLEDFCHLAKSNFSTMEYSRLKNSPAEKQIQIFYSIWTQKEALVKATGVGLTFGLSHWSTQPESNMYDIVIDQITYQMIPLDLHNNYSTCLCIMQKGE